MPLPGIRKDWLSLLIVAVFMCGVPVAFLVSSSRLSGGAEIMPVSMSIAMLAMSLPSLVKRLRRPPQTTPFFPAAKVLCVGTALLCFPMLAAWLGFYTTSWFYVLAGFCLFSGRADVRTLLLGILVSSTFCVVAWCLFYRFFTILTPKGLFY